MRSALILSAGIALSTIPAAAAVSSDPPRDAFVVAYTCPVYEGYPDCHPDSDVGAFTRSARGDRRLRTPPLPSKTQPFADGDSATAASAVSSRKVKLSCK
jgi:hypothetical protein